jgi:hypothetical protein
VANHSAFAPGVNAVDSALPPQSGTAAALTGQGDRRAQNAAAIKQIAEDRRQHLGETMAFTREELADLGSTGQILTLKLGLLSNLAEAARLNWKADVLPFVLAYVSIQSESRLGCCTYSVPRIARFLHRSDNSIRAALARAVEQKLLFREELPNGAIGYWPVVMKGMVNIAFSPHHVVDALAPAKPNGRPPTPPCRLEGVSENPPKITVKLPQDNLVHSSLNLAPTSTDKKDTNGNCVTASDDAADTTLIIPFPGRGRS